MKTPYFFLLGCLIATSQKTLQLSENTISPKATIEEVAWLQGHWRGEALGGIAEEIWSPPAGKSMMFAFRLLHDGKVTFYELGHIKQMNGTLLMQLKHFDGSLTGWEEKGETVDFKLVKLTDNAIYFEGMTIERSSEDSINFYVLTEENGKTNELVFEYSRFIN